MWCGKASGNKSDIEQQKAAYTEPGLLARGWYNSTQAETWKSAQQSPPPEDQLEEQTNTNFMEHTELQNSSSRRK